VYVVPLGTNGLIKSIHLKCITFLHAFVTECTTVFFTDDIMNTYLLLVELLSLSTLLVSNVWWGHAVGVGRNLHDTVMC